MPEMDGSMALMAMEEGAGTGEVVALAGARVGRLLYMPSALLAAHLPAGLGGMLRVPRLMEMEADERRCGAAGGVHRQHQAHRARV